MSFVIFVSVQLGVSMARFCYKLPVASTETPLGLLGRIRCLAIQMLIPQTGSFGHFLASQVSSCLVNPRHATVIVHHATIRQAANGYTIHNR